MVSGSVTRTYPHVVAFSKTSKNPGIVLCLCFFEKSHNKLTKANTYGVIPLAQITECKDTSYLSLLFTIDLPCWITAETALLKTKRIWPVAGLYIA